MAEQKRVPRFGKPNIPRRPRIAVLVLAGLMAVAAPAVSCSPASSEQQTMAVVQIVSSAPGEGVRVEIVPAQGSGEALQGQTPWQVALAPGEYRYVATAPGYWPVNGSIHVPPGTPTIAVEIPAMEPMSGTVLVRSNAEVDVFIDGTKQAQPAGPDPAVWVSYGPFPAGSHVVSASTVLGAQAQTVEVYADRETKVEFLWGSRLVVAVEPAGIPSVTVSVDAQPYTAPVDYDSTRLSSRPFVQVEATAPGYSPWSDDVFLQPGGIVTATAVLTPVQASTTFTDTVGEVVAAYHRFWQVWHEAGVRMDGDILPQVMTNPMLQENQEGYKELLALELLVSTTLTPSPHEPEQVEIVGDTARVVVSCFVSQTTKMPDGSWHTPLYRLEGAFIMKRGEDGVWRVADYEGSWKTVEPEPTPTPRRGGGWQKPPLPDRAKIISILLANINCLRAENGLPPVEYDPEMSAALQPVADAATAYKAACGWICSLPDNDAEIEAAIRPYGGRWLEESGMPLSYVPSLGQAGVFAYDWENYDGDPYPPCAAKYWHADDGEVNNKLLLRPMSRIAIVLGEPPYWHGVFYVSVMIIAGR